MLQCFMMQNPTTNELYFLLSVRADGSQGGQGGGAQFWPKSPKEGTPQEAVLASRLPMPRGLECLEGTGNHQSSWPERDLLKKWLPLPSVHMPQCAPRVWIPRTSSCAHWCPWEGDHSANIEGLVVGPMPSGEDNSIQVRGQGQLEFPRSSE